MIRAKWALLGLIGILAAAGAQTLVGGKKTIPATFADGVAAATKEDAKTVERFLKAFAPAVTEQLLAGRTVEVPGLGIVRVVRVKEYRDLSGGVPTTIPARNYVEIVAAPELDKVANQPGVVPARTVEPYEFRVNPDHNPGMKTEGVKVPRTRIGR